MKENLQRIQEKTQQLIQELKVLRQQNTELVAELKLVRQEGAKRQEQQQQSQVQQQVQQQRMEELQQQIAVLKLNNVGLNNSDRKELEKKINQYIKEIDRCIAQLGE